MNKNNFFSIEKGCGAKGRKKESEIIFFGMNLHVAFYAENFFWMRLYFLKHLHQLFSFCSILICVSKCAKYLHLLFVISLAIGC